MTLRRKVIITACAVVALSGCGYGVTSLASYLVTAHDTCMNAGPTVVMHEGAAGECVGISDGSYPFEAIDALKAACYFAAPIPIDLGGLGVSSAHDLVVARTRRKVAIHRGDLDLVRVAPQRVAVATQHVDLVRHLVGSAEEVAAVGVLRDQTQRLAFTPAPDEDARAG